MCAICGCGTSEVRLIHRPRRPRAPAPPRPHAPVRLRITPLTTSSNTNTITRSARTRHHHDHDHRCTTTITSTPIRPPVVPAEPASRRLVQLEQDLLAKNDAIAAHNRRWLEQPQDPGLQSPQRPRRGQDQLARAHHPRAGAGADLGAGGRPGHHPRRRSGSRRRRPAPSRSTPAAAATWTPPWFARTAARIAPAHGSLLFIENVGNLVCPALFDLGEQAKVVLLSVTEGEDKPLKYPHAFRSASVLVITKIDLLPHLDFDLDRCLARRPPDQPAPPRFPPSARRGDGMAAWCDWLRSSGPLTAPNARQRLRFSATLIQPDATPQPAQPPARCLSRTTSPRSRADRTAAGGCPRHRGAAGLATGGGAGAAPGPPVRRRAGPPDDHLQQPGPARWAAGRTAGRRRAGVQPAPAARPAPLAGAGTGAPRAGRGPRTPGVAPGPLRACWGSRATWSTCAAGTCGRRRDSPSCRSNASRARAAGRRARDRPGGSLQGPRRPSASVPMARWCRST